VRAATRAGHAGEIAEANSFPDKIIDERGGLPSASRVWYSPAFGGEQGKVPSKNMPFRIATLP